MKHSNGGGNKVHGRYGNAGIALALKKQEKRTTFKPGFFSGSGGGGDVVIEYYRRVYAPAARRMAQLLGAKMLRIKQMMGVYSAYSKRPGGGTNDNAKQ